MSEHHHSIPDTPEKASALLTHLCEHNESHEEELKALGEQLARLGFVEEASCVNEACALYARGNEKLRSASTSVGNKL